MARISETASSFSQSPDNLKHPSALVVVDTPGSGTRSSSSNGAMTANGQKLPSAVEFEPPIACVRRILKRSLPSSTNVGKDACAAFARACGIFIIYVTACSHDFARENKRQTITANDVLAAMKELDFEDFIPDMLQFLETYRLAEKTKKNAKAAAMAAQKPEGEGDDDENDGDEGVAIKKGEDDEEEDDDDENDDVIGEEDDVVGEDNEEDDLEDDEEGPAPKRLKTGDDESENDVSDESIEQKYSEAP